MEMSELTSPRQRPHEFLGAQEFKDLGAGLLFKIWHPVAISPVSTFSGLLEDFQVEDSHLLNHGKHRLSSECHLFKGTDPA